MRPIHAIHEAGCLKLRNNSGSKYSSLILTKERLTVLYKLLRVIYKGKNWTSILERAITGRWFFYIFSFLNNSIDRYSSKKIKGSTAVSFYTRFDRQF